MHTENLQSTSWACIRKKVLKRGRRHSDELLKYKYPYNIYIYI